MAKDSVFSKLLPSDSKARGFIVIGFVVVVLVVIYFFATREGGDDGPAASRTAKVPSGIQNIVGGKLTSEYKKAVIQANERDARSAQMAGRSSVAVMLNTEDDGYGEGAPQCLPSCDELSANDVVRNLLTSGKIDAATADKLMSMASNNASVADYAAELDRLVKEGKLTPEQARQLLAQYKKQHADAQVAQGAAMMDDLIASGELPLDIADELLNMQKAGASVDDYASELQRLVREGKISPETAAKLLAQYKKQKGEAAARESKAQMDNLVASGEISQEDADALLELQKGGASVDDYAAELDRLVREGKISPETAAKLLAQYKKVTGYNKTGKSAAERLNDLSRKSASEMAALSAEGLDALGKKSAAQMDDIVQQRLAELSQESRNQMDEWVKSGKVTPEAAKALLALQDKNVSPEDYAAELDRLVREGKISPEMRDKMLAQYKKLHAERAKTDLPPELKSHLLDLQSRNVSPEEYAAELDRLVREGKLSPEMRDRMLAQYKKIHQERAETTVPPEVADSLMALQNQEVTPEEYAAHLDRLVREGKISPAMRDKLLAQYRKIHAERAALLREVQLSGLVDQGLPSLDGLSAAQEVELPPLQVVDQPAAQDNEEGLTGFARLRARMQAASEKDKERERQARANFDSEKVIKDTSAHDAYLAAQKQAQLARDAHRQRIAMLASAMQGQAAAISNSWNLIPQQVRNTAQTDSMLGASDADAGDNATAAKGPLIPPIIRAGDIIFGVLDTEVNSDYPEQAVMATVVQGPFKGARVLGKLTLGGPDKEELLLQFTSMSMQTWPKALSINAMGIDPETAQQGMASSVDHHYFSRWGTLFATSFLSGYADAVSSAGQATISSDGETVAVTQAPISPAGRVMVGLGAVGKAASSEAQKNMNRPPTVILNSGVGVALLFVNDVADPEDFEVQTVDKTDTNRVLTTTPQNNQELRNALKEEGK